MKYYKLLKNEYKYRKVNKNKIYPETTVTGDYEVSQLVIDYPDDWKEVPENEYIFQEGCRLAKEIANKIESKSKEPIPQFASGGFTHKTENKMTHEEAIEILIDLSHYVGGNDELAIQYAINQLKQCQVYDKPVEMEVRTSDGKFFKNDVIGFFKGKPIAEDADCNWHYIYDYSRPIKKEPLSYSQYIEQMEGVKIEFVSSGRIDSYFVEYTEYLNQFKR